LRERNRRNPVTQDATGDEKLNWLYKVSSICVGTSLLLTTWAIYSFSQDMTEYFSLRGGQPSGHLLTAVLVYGWPAWVVLLPAFGAAWLAIGHKRDKVLAITVNCVLLLTMTVLFLLLGLAVIDPLVSRS
jgi:hypothetical protein